MSLTSCPECKKEVSNRAMACPHCGVPLRMRTRVVAAAAVAVVALAAGAAAFMALRRDDYARVDELRTEQDLAGTHDEHVKQRFYRLYMQHPHDAMYIYLWARCEDDPNKQLDLAQQGIAADPHFAWSYNIQSRALARLGRIGEALEAANHGESLDPGNYELARKITTLKAMTSHKLVEQPKLAAGGHVTYHGIVRAVSKPEHGDLATIEKNRAPSPKHVEEALANVVVCTNPFADACVRAYVAREDARPLKEHELVAVTGNVVANDDGDAIILAESIAVEPP